jgi:tetratricopeptide (TPR) repeat protein
VWQALYEELKDRGFVVITVAEDTAGNIVVRPWIERAHPTHPSLVDDRHIVSELYDMVNVPTAVWIDEDGRMVRLPEPAGAEDSFRGMDRTTFALSDEARASLAAAQREYQAAIRDWVANGEASRFLPGEAALRARISNPDDASARAAAEFEAGEYLHAIGRYDLAQIHFQEAKRLRPDSWNYKRQAWALEDPAKSGGPEYWAAVDALGDRRYYPRIQLEPASP